MHLKPRETVILADDFAAMIKWYQNALGFRVTRLFEQEYHYCNLETDSGIQLGIASASEMEVNPENRKNNTVVLQFEVQDVKQFLESVAANGGTVTFGPSFDKSNNFWYGGFADVEGNPFWVVDADCP